MNLRCLCTPICALALAGGLGACGNQEAHPHVADTEGGYVDAGPVTYQVQLSRELNPYSAEDKTYLSGIPVGTAQPARGEEWFAVWMWGKNQTGQPQRTAAPSDFNIVDTQGNNYQPVTIDPSSNPLAWKAQELQPLAVEPGSDTAAQFSATQGAELLFKINVSAYSNRPLTLQIRDRAQRVLGSVSLDL